MRIAIAAAVLGLLVVQIAPTPNLSGHWALASATLLRPGEATEQPSKQLVAEYLAFNCGRECYVTYEKSILTVENATFDENQAAGLKTVIVVDGRVHPVVNSVTNEHTIDTVSRWQDGKLLLTTTPHGQPIVQAISIENGQLVVRRSAGSVQQTIRYSRRP